MTFVNLIRDDLRDLIPYSSARSEANQGRIWLNANELPWDNKTNRYPEQQPQKYIDSLANYYAVDKQQILVTRGSDEGIDLLVRLFCQFNQDQILISTPTFGMYEVSAKLQGVETLKIPLNSDQFTLDTNAILSQWNPRVKILFLCSPNNPTGNLVSPDKINDLCEKLSGKSIIVVDEAYVEFTEAASLSNLVNTFDNLVVLRTLSKAFGLAAARVGALLANENLITWLKKILPPYPLSTLSMEAVHRALQPNALETMRDRISKIIEQRQHMIKTLQTLKITDTVWNSEANFIFIKFTRPVEPICMSNGIVLRNMEKRTGIKNSVRITVGTPAENSQLLTLLSTL